MGISCVKPQKKFSRKLHSNSLQWLKNNKRNNYKILVSWKCSDKCVWEWSYIHRVPVGTGLIYLPIRCYYCWLIHTFSKGIKCTCVCTIPLWGNPLAFSLLVQAGSASSICYHCILLCLQPYSTLAQELLQSNTHASALFLGQNNKSSGDF